jgi:hypothetical protein
MLFVPKSSLNLFLTAGALLTSWMIAPLTAGADPLEPQSQHAEPVQAQFRGCESAGWCRFLIESPDPLAQSPYRVYPDGVPRSPCNNAISIEVRDRLNALLASMVHQHKRIVLHDLRELEGGMFAATVTVNESNLAEDPMLLELHETLLGTER